METASGACAPLVNTGNGKLYICNQFAGTVSELDKNGKNIVRTVKVLREPKSAVFDKEGKHLFVTNFLPMQRADVDTVAACVSVIDMNSFRKIKDIQLANGSNALRGMSLSPDGVICWLLIIWVVSRFRHPSATRLDEYQCHQYR